MIKNNNIYLKNTCKSICIKGIFTQKVVRCSKYTHSKDAFFCKKHDINNKIIEKKKNLNNQSCFICLKKTKKEYFLTPCCNSFFCKNCIHLSHYSTKNKNNFTTISDCPACNQQIFSTKNFDYENENILFICKKM